MQWLNPSSQKQIMMENWIIRDKQLDANQFFLDHFFQIFFILVLLLPLIWTDSWQNFEKTPEYSSMNWNKETGASSGWRWVCDLIFTSAGKIDIL